MTHIPVKNAREALISCHSDYLKSKVPPHSGHLSPIADMYVLQIGHLKFTTSGVINLGLNARINKLNETHEVSPFRKNWSIKIMLNECNSNGTVTSKI